MPVQQDGSDPEGGKVYREWEFSQQQAPGSQAGLRGRPAGGYSASSGGPSGGGQSGQEAADGDHLLTRSELFRDRPQEPPPNAPKNDPEAQAYAKDK